MHAGALPYFKSCLSSLSLEYNAGPNTPIRWGGGGEVIQNYTRLAEQHPRRGFYGAKVLGI